MRGLEQRLSRLEHISQPQSVKVVFTQVIGGKEHKSSSDYIVNQCISSCPDKELYQRALEAAFVSVTGENPYEQQGMAFIVINNAVSLELVRNLEEQGIEVSV